jgi:mono/diheme cytochrome c family protein
MPTLSNVMIGVLLLTAVSTPCAFAGTAKVADSKPLDRGRYLVRIAGCNDCHTPGYAEAAGNVLETQWLTGDKLGWRGAWGTTYPVNLRLYMQNLSEDQWVKVAKTAQFRPPMPWFNLHAMNEQDLRAIYRLIQYLGPAGEPAPAFVPPGQEPKGPFALFP